MLYCGRGRSSMAYVDELSDLLGGSLTIVDTAEGPRADIASWVGAVGADALIYCCGPFPLTSAVENASRATGSARRFRREHFGTVPRSARGAVPVAADRAFAVTLARSGVSLTVPVGRTLLDAISDVVPGISRDCEEGYCGACETRVLAGKPLHRDSVLTEEEQAANRSMIVCVGRACGEGLILDV